MRSCSRFCSPALSRRHARKPEGAHVCGDPGSQAAHHQRRPGDHRRRNSPGRHATRTNRVLSADKTKLHIVTTAMQVETVDLAAKKVISSFLAFRRQKLSPHDPRRRRKRFLGHCGRSRGRYLYATISLTVKELDQFRTDPPQFVQIDLQEKKISQVDSFSQRLRPGIRICRHLQNLAGWQAPLCLRR